MTSAAMAASHRNPTGGRMFLINLFGKKVGALMILQAAAGQGCAGEVLLDGSGVLGVAYMFIPSCHDTITTSTAVRT